MKADYYRYFSEYAQGDQYNEASSKAKQAYYEATEIATTNLKTTNPIRLGLALNYSVFQYEVISLFLGDGRLHLSLPTRQVSFR